MFKVRAVYLMVDKESGLRLVEHIKFCLMSLVKQHSAGMGAKLDTQEGCLKYLEH